MRVQILVYLLTTCAIMAAPKVVKFPVVPTSKPSQSIHSLALAPNGNLLAIGRYGKIQSASPGAPDRKTEIGTLTGNANALLIYQKTVFAAGGDAGIAGEVKIWNLHTKKPTRTLTGHKDAIYAMALTADGKILATGSYDRKIILWNTANGKPTQKLEGHNGAIYGLAFRKGGQVLASASADATVKLWEVKTGKRLDTLSQPLKAQHAIAFHPGGRRLVAGGADNRIREWHVSARAKEGSNPLVISRFAHEGTLLRLRFSPDGKHLLSTADNQTAKLWNANTLQATRDFGKLSDWPTAAALSNTTAYIGQLDGQLKNFPIKK